MEVVTYLPAKVGLCRVCDLADAFRIQLREEAWDVDLSALMQALDEVDAPVRLTSPFTLRGLYLMIRHGTGRLPLVIVRGRLVHAGPVGEPKELAKKIRDALSVAGGKSRRSPPLRRPVSS
ncbi:MAG: hypothetical protein JHC20_03535 [Pyrobaculum sp.]|nr:hypothetical protein [Pyrobaculum sp.]